MHLYFLSVSIKRCPIVTLFLITIACQTMVSSLKDGCIVLNAKNR